MKVHFPHTQISPQRKRPSWRPYQVSPLDQICLDMRVLLNCTRSMTHRRLVDIVFDANETVPSLFPVLSAFNSEVNRGTGYMLKRARQTQRKLEALSGLIIVD